MDIQKSNQLIAEFMKWYSRKDLLYVMPAKYIPYQDHPQAVWADGLDFDKSWNWLMPVVGKMVIYW